MAGESFRRPGFGFTGDDVITLAARTLDRDSRGVADWLAEHVHTHRDMHALLEFVGRAIYKTWPMALTKGVEIGEGEFWAMMQGADAKPSAVASTQIITASLNGDWENLTALINATITTRPEEFHAEVTAHLLAALGDGLRAVTDSTEPPNPR